MRAAALPLLLLLAACAPAPGNDPPAGAAPAAAVVPAVDVVELDIATASRRMAAGELSSRALTQAYLDRIAAIDDAGPTLNAVIEIAPDALAQAEARDAERAAGQVRGPLHGIPVLVKDNVDVAGMANSAGSLALAGHQPADDAFLVARLREAGAVILGKANLSEWANFRSTRSVSGWSSRGGLTRNPYALDRSACGSSSGTGAGIAASLATVGIGTETDGSILCPAAVNGLVGLKPTVGRVSRDGIIPISISQDTAGPMARTVADAAALLQAMSAPDPGDPAARGEAGVDLLSGLREDALAGKRVGVLRQAMGGHPDVDAAMEQAIAALRAAGAEVVDPVEIPTWREWRGAEFEVLLYEFKDGLDRYLADSGAPVGSLAALIEWNREHADRAMPWFAQELLEQAQAKGPLTEPAYLQAKADARRLAGEQGLLAALAAHGLDAVVAPTTGPAWPIDPVLGDRSGGASYGVAAVAGTPSLTVPMGEVRGLPIGLAFMGPADSEAALLAMGHAFEQATRARKPPTYRAGVLAD